MLSGCNFVGCKSLYYKWGLAGLMERRAEYERLNTKYWLLRRIRCSNCGNGFDGISKPVALLVNFLAQVFPDGVRHLQKDANHFRVKLAARKANDLFPRGANALRGAIRPV